jgi:hypothetical protein
MEAMTAILGGWNPARSAWADHEQAVEATARGRHVAVRWGVSRRRHGVGPGDRFYVLRQGAGRRGLVASGTVVSGTYEDAHWDGTPGRTIRYVDVELDRVVDPADVLPVELLLELCGRTNWSPQSSGTSVHPRDEARVERLWQEHLAAL